jgi:hypothetical protein
MILGMTTLTFVHVVISLIGIFSGLLCLLGMLGMLGGKLSSGWTGLFLLTTVLTSVTGFFFPFHHLLPSHIFGILSLIALAAAVPALYVFHLAGSWRKIYAITALIALYFNMFVLVAQLFSKVPALHPLAPTQSEPPFFVAEVVVMVLFIAISVVAVGKFSKRAAHAS